MTLVLCKLGLAGAAIVPVVIAGCSMCCGTYDYDYPMFHSNYSRMDPENGRVGSIFTDPNVGPGVRPLTNAEAPQKDRYKRNQGPDTPEVDPNFDNDPFRGEDPEVQQDTAVRFQCPPQR